MTTGYRRGKAHSSAQRGILFTQDVRPRKEESPRQTRHGGGNYPTTKLGKVAEPKRRQGMGGQLARWSTKRVAVAVARRCLGKNQIGGSNSTTTAVRIARRARKKSGRVGEGGPATS